MPVLCLVTVEIKPAVKRQTMNVKVVNTSWCKVFLLWGSLRLRQTTHLQRGTGRALALQLMGPTLQSELAGRQMERQRCFCQASPWRQEYLMLNSWLSVAMLSQLEAGNSLAPTNHCCLGPSPEVNPAGGSWVAAR